MYCKQNSKKQMHALLHAAPLQVCMLPQEVRMAG
jgi:hypothetical protein